MNIGDSLFNEPLDKIGAKLMLKRLFPITVYMVCLFYIYANVESCAQETPYYFVTDDDFPPYSYERDGNIVGIDCDIVREMARRMGIRIRLELVPWARLIEMTKSGKADGAFSLFWTPERETFAMFAREQPIHRSLFYLFIRKDSTLTYNSITDLYGKKIGINRGFSINPEFDNAVKNHLITVEEVEGVVLNLLKLKAGRIDGFISNYVVVMYYLKSMESMKREIEHIPEPVTRQREAYLAVSRLGSIPDPSSFLRTVNTVLSDMFKDGAFHSIYMNYIDRVNVYLDMLNESNIIHDKEVRKYSEHRR